MSKIPDSIYVELVTQAPLRTKEGLQLLLDGFESVEEFTPTHWGEDERARNPYNREELLEEISGLTSETYMPGLHRRKPPRYEAYFTASNSGLKVVKVEFGSNLRQKDLPLIFKFGDALAERLQPEYGFVHMVWRLGEESQAYSAAGSIKLSKFMKCGLRPPVARTWYGAHLVDLVGRERLESADVSIEETAWGGVRLDLVEKPWESDFETLRSKQTEVMESLEPSGVFGDYSDWYECKPGPNWKPIPEKAEDTSK